MREALRGLTTRGRAFLAAGLAAVLCAVGLDQAALGRVGILILVLPLVTAVFVARSRYRLALVRTVGPQLVTAGQPATVSLALTNEGRTPSGVLLLEDQVPYVLGTRPRFVLSGMGHGWRRTVTYQVRSDVRGRFEIGPMSVRVNDPFGLVELGRAFRTTVAVTVTPRTVPLPPISLGGAAEGAGDNRPRSFAVGSAEDLTVREYHRGDDLRRVHWRSSARVGELMVRREEQPWQSRATILLDNRVRAHRGQGIAASFETAVSVAASIAVHLSSRGYTIRLVTAGGADPSHAWQSRDAHLNSAPILESLAMVDLIQATRLDTSWLADQSGGSVTVAVLGGVETRDGVVLRRIRHTSTSALAIALDVGEWGSPARSTGHAVPMLTHAGWRAAPLRPRDRLETVWQELGSSLSRTGGRARASAPGQVPGAIPAGFAVGGT